MANAILKDELLIDGVSIPGYQDFLEVDGVYSQIWPTKGFVPYEKNIKFINADRYYPCANIRRSGYAYLRCRRCLGCLQLRSATWTARALVESKTHPRTWVVRYSFRDLSTGYDDFQKYLKRLRKRVGTPVRYAVFTEGQEGSDTRPHMHALIHGEATLRYRDVSEPYTAGHEHTRLLKDPVTAARYVAKYITKDPTERIRASIGYGRGYNKVPF